MKLFAPLFAPLLASAALVSGVLSSFDINWAAAVCDNQKGGTTAETCCKKPPFEKYGLELNQPKEGTCVELALGGVPFTYQAIESKAKPYKEPLGPAFQMYLALNVPADSPVAGSDIVFQVPTCFGDGAEPRSVIYPYDDVIHKRLLEFKYLTWGFQLISVLYNGTHFDNYDFAGVKNDTGIWISEDCRQLRQDMCDGKVPDPPKNNPFYKEAMASCASGGGGGGGGGKGGHGGHGGKSSGDSPSCSKASKRAPHSSRHKGKEACPGSGK